MAATPCDWASAWIWLPTVLSSGSNTRTLAPRLMSACASASSVASLPWALSILKSDDPYPAALKALVRYGRSKFTYRVEDVVSGRMTPTIPLPALNRPDSWLIAEKLLSNDVRLRPDGTVAAALDEAGAEELGVLLPQATAMPAIPSTAPHLVARVTVLEPVVSVRMLRPPTRYTANLCCRSDAPIGGPGLWWAPSAASSSLSWSARASAPRMPARSEKAPATTSACAGTEKARRAIDSRMALRSTSPARASSPPMMIICGLSKLQRLARATPMWRPPSVMTRRQPMSPSLLSRTRSSTVRSS